MSTTAPRRSPRPRPKVMTMTPAAVERVRKLVAAKGPSGAGLKIGVKKGGCAGMEYTMDWVESVSKFDEVVEQEGARVIVDPQAIASRQITVGEMAAAITRENANISAGAFDEGKRRYIVRTVGQYKKPADIENVIVRGGDGTRVRVGDMAFISSTGCATSPASCSINGAHWSRTMLSQLYSS